MLQRNNEKWCNTHLACGSQKARDSRKQCSNAASAAVAAAAAAARGRGHATAAEGGGGVVMITILCPPLSPAAAPCVYPPLRRAARAVSTPGPLSARKEEKGRHECADLTLLLLLPPPLLPPPLLPPPLLLVLT
eukprot:TRINITY_DN1087_c1_g1_i19.p1 TRINITY_DN1087_c1_g1~~TRINITY_DN1087_c1_g1_i19.p1  ORF type:complete len:134 (-),score=28.81 TRINITY_DN1087_c1_g1_i19:26-427(-)